MDYTENITKSQNPKMSIFIFLGWIQALPIWNNKAEIGTNTSSSIDVI